MKRVKILFAFFLLLALLPAQAQDFEAARSMNLSLDYQQVKESMNYGLVFSGPQLRFTYRKGWKLAGKNIIYQGALGTGLYETRNILGLNINLKLIDVHYNIYEFIRKISFFAGPWLKSEYNYQLYPDLQSGYSFHFTNYTFGLSLTMLYRSDACHARLQWKNSVAGLISRPPQMRDPYFFDLDFSNYAADQHNEFSAGSFGLYNNTEIEIHFVRPQHARVGYAYSFAWFHGATSPAVDFIRHSLSVYFYPKLIK